MTTWTSKPSGPPTAPARAAAAVSSVSMTASTANANAGLAQAAAGAASDAAADASDAAAIAAAKFNAVPEANIVVANVDPQIVPEDWGVGFKPITGTDAVVSAERANENGGNLEIALTLPVGFSAKAVLVFLSWCSDDSSVAAYCESGRSTSYTEVASVRQAIRAGTDMTAGISVFMATNVNLAGVSEQVYTGAKRTGSGWSTGTQSAWMVAIDGSFSGEIDVTTKQSPVTSLAAPDDSAAIVFNSLFQTRTAAGNTAFSDLTISATAPGMTLSHSMSNLTRTTLTGVRTSEIALTKNIDTAETLSISTSPSSDGGKNQPPSIQGLGLGLVLKSLSAPLTDTIGSFAEISTTDSGSFTQTVGSFNPFTKFFETLRLSPDIDVDAGTASFTVSYIGTYDVDVDLLCNETHDMTLGIAVNGTIVAARRCSGYSMAISTKVYAKEGDVISLKVKNNASGNITLDTLSRMTISLVNRSYL